MSSCMKRCLTQLFRSTRILLPVCQNDSYLKHNYAFTRQHVFSVPPVNLCCHSVRFLQTSETQKKANEVPDEKLFDEEFSTVSAFLANQLTSMGMSDVSLWFEKVLNYNVPHGKRNRGLSLLKTYTILVPNASLEERRLAAILGWCIEMIQGFFLVLDDVMDQSLTRRGKPCWYRQEGVGLMALNDAVLIECGTYQVLKAFFSHHTHYVDMVNTFNEVVHFTSVGQCLDMMSTPCGSKPNFDKFTEARHEEICKMKTAHYTFCLSLHLALLLAGKKELYTKEVESIMLSIGQYFQVQDDFIDCFGDPAITGKKGSDIEDGKCSWPIVKALQVAGNEEKIVLKENYGTTSPDSVKAVMNIYQKLGIPSIYQEYETEMYTSLSKRVEQYTKASNFPAEIFRGFLQNVYKRSK